MQMVAAARLRKAQVRAISARAYAAKLDELLGRLTADGAHSGHALLATRPVRKVTVLVVTADRGLAGSYNTNLFRRAEARLAALKRGGLPVETELLVIGRKGRDYFRRRGFAIAREEVGVADDDLADLARGLSVGLIDRFTRGATDEVVLVYSKFLSALQQRPVDARLLPVAQPETQAGADHGLQVLAGYDGQAPAGYDSQAPAGYDSQALAGREPGAPAGLDDEAAAETGAGVGGRRARRARDEAAQNAAQYRYIYEPSARSVYTLLLPKYVSNQLFQAFLEARASEYAARMTAMAAATDNAEDLVGKLTLQMHHARQGSITQEIMELVGGAEALKEK